MFEYIDKLAIDEKIKEINKLRMELHKYSPFNAEPVDCVLWIKNENVVANDYNPNTVAPPEMKLLETSIEQDGYTQPIVSWNRDNVYEVVDGFHRHRVGKESKIVNNRVMGYLPLTVIKDDRQEKGDRIASTIRHNRARGKHKVEAMSDIVIELKKRNWSNEKISKNLGMDEDEVLRLCQISGLAEVFKNTEFSQAWESEIFKEDDFKLLSEDDIDDKKIKDTKRIFHTWEKWECYKKGFYAEQPPSGYTPETAEIAYRDFLSNENIFSRMLDKILSEWTYSCQHYLSNENMNRIAWLGQAAMCEHSGIPAKYRGGYNLLTEEQKNKADSIALIYLNKWLKENGFEQVKDLESAQSKTEANLY